MNQTSDDSAPIYRRILRMVFAMGLCAIGAIIAIAVWMSQSVDRIAQEDAIRLVKTAIAGRVDYQKKITLDYGDWGSAWRWITERDDAAVYDNMGTGATEGGVFDRLMIFDADGTPLYAYEAGGQGHDVTVFLPELRDTYLPKVADTEVYPYEAVSGFTEIDGMLAIVTAGRVLPYDYETQATDGFPVIISTHILDDKKLRALEEALLLDGFRFDTSRVASRPETELAVTFSDLTGAQIGALVWQAPSPGRAMLRQAYVVIAALSGLMILCSFVVGQLSMTQTRAFLAERWQARTDSLTGLLNRSGLMERVSTQQAEQAIASGFAAAVYCDLNTFKQLNDDLGHDAGDWALRHIAERIQLSARSEDIVARLGGDEFIVVILGPDAAQAATRIVERLTAQFNTPIHIQGYGDHSISVSVGLAHAGPEDTWRGLINRADTAMYDAKRTGKRTYVTLWPSPTSTIGASDDGVAAQVQVA